MISVQEALSRIIAERPRGAPVTLPLAQTLGCILAKDVAALVSLPPLAASAMDGYAVRLEDVREAGAALKVIGEAPAGHPFAGRVRAGQAVRIFTGGAVPDGADHIIIQENVARDGDNITVNTPSEAARHIRKAGIDFFEGTKLISAGTLIGPPEIALAAAANHAQISAYPRLKIALLANGDELRPPGSILKSSEIISSNPLALGALITQWGGEILDMGIAGDSLAAITALIEAAREADIIIPIGGASVGDHDYMRPAFREAGLKMIFEKVAVRPGKPTWFGKLGEQRVLGLPGNPASAIVCAHLFLKALMGRHNKLAKAALTQGLPANGPRETYQRGLASVTETGHLIVTPFPRQDSSLLSPFARANVLIRLPVSAGPWAESDLIDIVALGTGPAIA